MNCSSCGQSNPAGARFCNACATPLAAACGACGGENPPGAKFCNGCGAELQAVGRLAPTGLGAPGESASAANRLAYTPRHLAEKILQSRSALEGERKQVTVLFADLKGSMELAEQLDPEEWTKSSTASSRSRPRAYSDSRGR